MSVIFDDEKPEAYHWRRMTENRIEQLEMNSATKTDIAELKLMIIESENRMAVRLVEMKGEIMAQFAEHKGEVTAQFAEHKGEILAQFSEHKGEVKAQIADAKTSIIQWIVTAVFIAQLLPILVKLLIPG